MTSLQALSAEMFPAIQQELKSVLNADIFPPTDHLYGMMQYHMGWLDEELAPANAKAGKQIRPLLLLLVCHAAGGDWRKAVPAAAAIELIHNFSLIHDDIEDNSPTRRGRTTLWKIWGIPLAINAGDAMFAAAHLALNRLVDHGVDPAVIVTAFRRFDETCIRLTQGQHADMSFETRQTVSVDEYLEMITGKTSVLLQLCGELGAMIAGADATTVQHYGKFALNLGLAFQVLDDVLGIWGDEEKIGKSATTDIETRKKTLPVLYGLSQSEPLQALYAAEDQDNTFVSQVVGLLNQHQAREYSEAYATNYSNTALEHLQAAEPTHTKPLTQLTSQLLQRQS